MAKKTTKKQPRISVIIPVYNCEEYIQRCLDSVYEQTFQDFEIILINDGSADGSLKILQQNAEKHSRITLIDQENHGQGYARNQAIDIAKGEYLLFVDADDFIEPLTMELTVARAEQDHSDLVHFDWKLSTAMDIQPDSLKYYNVEPFLHKNVLIGAECDELMRTNNYFSVNNLYRKSFLDEKGIRYDEGHIYEDNTFMVAIANRAEKISLIHSPLYVVQKNLKSTTQSHTDTDKHYRAHIRAIRKSFEDLTPRTPFTTFYLAGYYLEKLIVYYERRVPVRYRSAYIKEFVDILSVQKLAIPNDHSGNRFLRMCVERGVFTNRRYAMFRVLIAYKLKLLPRGKRAITRARQLKHRLVYPPGNYPDELKKPITKGSIVFLGFNNRYTGNSRYLFEEIIGDKRFADREIKFICNDDLIPEKHRLIPKTDEAAKWLGRAETVIAETWIPGDIKKRDGSTWIQLWHGTPLKKMLFDSHEPEIVTKRNQHKIEKYRDIQRWDYFVVDSSMAADKFASAFHLPRERMVVSGYPRVKYLLENQQNEKLKQEIRQKIGLSAKLQNKKIVLYAPTWRDYNYGKETADSDFSYLLDSNKLAEKLGDDYLVLIHDHAYLSSSMQAFGDGCLDVSEYEIQEMLLIADGLVTDYSSIVFDAFAINLPIVILAKDDEKYRQSRGVYTSIWSELQGWVADEGSIVKVLAGFKMGESYERFKEKYCYDSVDSLSDLVSNVKGK